MIRNVRLYDALGNEINPETIGEQVINNNDYNLGTVEYGAEVNKIEVIKVNGQTQVISNKSIDIIPTMPQGDESNLGSTKLYSSTGNNSDGAVTQATFTTLYNALLNRGRYLSIWDCTTGLAMTSPQSLPYDYRTGDYFIVGNVGATNYKPYGSQYTGVASTIVETETPHPNDTYYYDGTSWYLLTGGGQVSIIFSSIAGSPYDNTNLSNALNTKQDINRPRTTLATSGTIALTDNSVNYIAPTGAVTFTLPAVSDNTTFHEILVQINLTSAQTMNLGTTYFFNTEAPDLSQTGEYNLIYEYDGSHWVVGALTKGTAS